MGDILKTHCMKRVNATHWGVFLIGARKPMFVGSQDSCGEYLCDLQTCMDEYRAGC